MAAIYVIINQWKLIKKNSDQNRGNFTLQNDKIEQLQVLTVRTESMRDKHKLEQSVLCWRISNKIADKIGISKVKKALSPRIIIYVIINPHFLSSLSYFVSIISLFLNININSRIVKCVIIFLHFLSSFLIMSVIYYFPFAKYK